MLDAGKEVTGIAFPLAIDRGKKRTGVGCLAHHSGPCLVEGLGLTHVAKALGLLSAIAVHQVVHSRLVIGRGQQAGELSQNLVFGRFVQHLAAPDLANGLRRLALFTRRDKRTRRDQRARRGLRRGLAEGRQDSGRVRVFIVKCPLRISPQLCEPGPSLQLLRRSRDLCRRNALLPRDRDRPSQDMPVKRPTSQAVANG